MHLWRTLSLFRIFHRLLWFHWCHAGWVVMFAHCRLEICFFFFSIIKLFCTKV